MFKYSLKIMFSVTIMAFVMSCKSTSKPLPFLDISTKEMVFGAEANQKSTTVSSGSAFEACSSSPAWCTIEVLPSIKKDNLKVSVTANETFEERAAIITVSCDDMTDNVTVNQIAGAPAVSVKETGIVINEDQSLDFSLEITANIPVVFDLPTWIKGKEGNTPVVGKKTCSFQADALKENIPSRTENITVKSADPSYGVSVAVPVKQNGKVCKLRIATYNIYVNDWDNRSAMVIGLTQKYNFDIFGVQEATISHMNSLIENGTYAYTGRDVGFHNPRSGNAIFYKKDRFELLKFDTFWYSETPEDPSMGWDAKYARICTWGKFKDNVSKREFYVFDSHFDHVGVIAPIKSAKLLLSQIKSIAGNSPVFAIGDFNWDTESEPIQKILDDGLLKDARILTEQKPTGPLGTFNGSSNTASTRRIDFVFVTKDIRVKEYHVFNDRPNGKFPSDHDPVLIIAEF